MKINVDLILHSAFWGAFFTAFWGAFEQAYQTGNDPIFSDWIFHHYIWGFMLTSIMFVLVTRQHYIQALSKLRR